MLEQGVIVIGTDTGVGKTCVATALLLALRSHGIAALPMKPVQTGAEHGRAPDLDAALAAAGLSVDAARYDELAPYRLPLPASPHLAARVAGARIDPERIVSLARRMQAAGQPLVVEAAGGALVPINDHTLQVDLLLRFNLPLILVARPGLGTLNHTLLTLEALRRREAVPCGIVLNGANPEGDLIEQDNRATLQRMNPDVPVLPFPRLSDLTPDALRHAGRALLDGLKK